MQRGKTGEAVDRLHTARGMLAGLELLVHNLSEDYAIQSNNDAVDGCFAIAEQIIRELWKEIDESLKIIDLSEGEPVQAEETRKGDTA